MLVYEEIRNCCLQNIIATSTQSRSRLVGKMYPAGSLMPRLVGKLYPAGSLRSRLVATDIDKSQIIHFLKIPR